MFTNASTESKTTYQEGQSVGLFYLEPHLKRALKVQIKELLHWFDEAMNDPFAGIAAEHTGTNMGQCCFCDRN